MTKSTVQNVQIAPQVQSNGVTEPAIHYQIGNKTVRLDLPSNSQERRPHLLPSNVAFAVAESHDEVLDFSWGAGVVEMGLGNVVENNAAFLQSSKEAARLEQSGQPSSKVTKPAWEVDYFPWPRVSRKLLQTHQGLFDQIGEQVLEELQTSRSRIGVCSTFQREGKTTLATCLARWSALKGKRTLLIDADVERPKMTLMCGMDMAFGWQSLLDTDIPASEAMVRSVESGLIFMPSRVTVPSNMDAKSIDRLSMITFQMKYEFDVVVVDMGTIDNVCAHGDPAMDVVDAMLITRDPTKTSLGQAMDTRTVLENHGLKKIYVAQNFARPKPSC